MDVVPIVVIVATALVLITIAVLYRDRLTKVHWKFWQVEAEVDAAPETKLGRSQFRLRRNRLRKKSKIDVPDTIGLEMTDNKLTDSSVRIRGTEKRLDK